MIATPVYRIALTGPESTGKTTLGEQLAAHYQTLCVPDCSRLYIEKLQRPYGYNDVLEIGRQIIAAEEATAAHANKILFSDNCLINIKIWLNWYHWPVPAWLLTAIRERGPHLYFLCNIDVPWQADSQRANPNDRQVLFNSFQKELVENGVYFKVLTGNNLHRFTGALQEVDKCMKKRIM